MMMSRPEPKAKGDKVAPVVEKVVHSQPKTTHEAVEDLERRLAMLGEVKPVEGNSKQETKRDDPLPAFTVPPETKAQEVKGGKAALLVSKVPSCVKISCDMRHFSNRVKSHD
jgi:hypothetical protein